MKWANKTHQIPLRLSVHTYGKQALIPPASSTPRSRATDFTASSISLYSAFISQLLFQWAIDLATCSCQITVYSSPNFKLNRFTNAYHNWNLWAEPISVACARWIFRMLTGANSPSVKAVTGGWLSHPHTLFLPPNIKEKGYVWQCPHHWSNQEIFFASLHP